MSQTYYDNIKKPKLQDTHSARDLKNLRILSQNSAEGFMSRREHCGSYIVSVFENIPKNLLVQGRVQLEHISHIKIGVEATYIKTSTSDVYWRKQPNRQSQFGTMLQETWLPRKHAKPDRVIQQNCGEVRTHASWKITRTWENFNNRGMKMIFLSDEPQLIANNSKCFVNGIKPIIRNNLDLCKHF